MTSLILLSKWQESQIKFWGQVKDFPGYDVSNFGRVRSWLRRTGANNPRVGGGGYVIRRDMPPQVLRFGLHRQGYLTAYLYKLGEKRHQFPAHQLVQDYILDERLNLV